MTKNKKQIDDLLGSINKRFGNGSATRMSDKPSKYESISSGSISFDIALGNGLPKGRIVELYGNESCGKTGLMLEVIAEVQKNGGIAAIVDVEHALNVELCEKIGVDLSSLIISQPDNAEDAMEIVREYVSSGVVDIIGLDSVAGLSTKAEMSGEIGEAKIGTTARLMSQTLRMLTGAVSKSNCTLIFINQLREKIGVMYGPSEVTSGGKALKFYASIRCEVRRNIKADQGGFLQKVKIVKNKVAPAYKKIERFIHFENGINKELELLSVATEAEIVERKGAWYNYGDIKLGQGAEKSADLLRDNPELCEEILKKIKEKLAQ